MKMRTKGTRWSPLFIGVARRASCAYAKKFQSIVTPVAPIYERVTNYLELPNNPSSFLRRIVRCPQRCMLYSSRREPLYLSHRESQTMPYANPQKNLRSPAPRIHLYYIRKDAVSHHISLIRSMIDSFNRMQRQLKFPKLAGKNGNRYGNGVQTNAHLPFCCRAYHYVIFNKKILIIKIGITFAQY